jgi:hypothetical protein
VSPVGDQRRICKHFYNRLQNFCLNSYLFAKIIRLFLLNNDNYDDGPIYCEQHSCNRH